MIRTEILLIILGMTLVTYLPRVLPLIALNRLPLPTLLYRWLSYVPVAVLAALLGPSLAIPRGELELGFTNTFLIAAIPTFFVALKTRSMAVTVLVGILASAVLSFIF